MSTARYSVVKWQRRTPRGILHTLSLQRTNGSGGEPTLHLPLPQGAAWLESRNLLLPCVAFGKPVAVAFSPEQKDAFEAQFSVQLP